MNNQVLEININDQDSKLITIQVLLALIIIATVAIATVLLISEKSPYIDEVLSFQGNVERGEAIFAVNCAGCHGIKGNGDVGPSIHDVIKHNSETSIINQVIDGKTPPMPKFQPSAEEMADLLSYLRQLSNSN